MIRQRYSSSDFVSPVQIEVQQSTNTSCDVIDNRFARDAPYWKIKGNDGSSTIGLTLRSGIKGHFKQQLSPGEYVLHIKLHQKLNRHGNSGSSGLMNSAASLMGSKQTDRHNTRSMPFSSVVVNVTVSDGTNGKIHTGGSKLSLGGEMHYRTSFTVKEDNMYCIMELKLKSLSLVKALKVSGVLWKRDLQEKKEELDIMTMHNDFDSSKRRSLIKVGKSLIVTAYSRPPFMKNNSLEDLLEKFYDEYAPKHKSFIPRMVSENEGNESKLFTDLERKYGVKFDKETGRAKQV